VEGLLLQSKPPPAYPLPVLDIRDDAQGGAWYPVNEYGHLPISAEDTMMFMVPYYEDRPRSGWSECRSIERHATLEDAQRIAQGVEEFLEAQGEEFVVPPIDQVLAVLQAPLRTFCSSSGSANRLHLIGSVCLSGEGDYGRSYSKQRQQP
jgi:hypothetical protein